MVHDLLLSEYLKRIDAVYDIQQIINQPVDIKRVTDYYTQSRFGYNIFHSMRGAIHIALSADGTFRNADYYAQANFIRCRLQDKENAQVLEIASGKGFNTLYLAGQRKHHFVGVDITPIHVAIAKRSAAKVSLTNVEFHQGDFHDLDFAIERFDCAFAIESICHALDLRQALESICRVLKPKAEFIIFDSFRKRDDLTQDEVIATQLIERSMAIQRFAPLNEFLSTAEAAGFEVVEVQDISRTVMPNLRRFENLARLFFAFPPFSILLKWLLPEYLTHNAIAGLLLPMASERKILPYYRIILRQK